MATPYPLLPQGEYNLFVDICVINEETGFYFLQTRYYDPEIGRFMTIDDISYLDPESINGLNLYAYCLNNPVMYVDASGTSPEW